MIHKIRFKVRDNKDGTDRWELRFEKRNFPRTLYKMAKLPKGKRVIDFKLGESFKASYGTHPLSAPYQYLWIYIPKQMNNGAIFKNVLQNNGYADGDDIELEIDDKTFSANVIGRPPKGISVPVVDRTGVKIKRPLEIKTADEAKFVNIIDMALDFSAMMRLFEKGTKYKIKENLLEEIKQLSKIKTETEYQKFHDNFCDWGSKNIVLTQRRNRSTGKITKKSGMASYGQMAKILDVVLHVVIYYAHYPNNKQAQTMSKWLNPALDNEMMKFLKRYYRNNITPWPVSIEQVDKTTYGSLQEIVRKFIREQRNGDILPIQFDDIYWEALNR